MNIKEFLMRFNGGILRGSQVRLARKLHVTEASVSRWVDGSQKPSEQYILAMARLVGCNPSEVAEAFGVLEKKTDEFAPLSSVRGIPLTPNNTITLPILADVPAGLPEFSSPVPLDESHFLEGGSLILPLFSS